MPFVDSALVHLELSISYFSTELSQDSDIFIKYLLKFMCNFICR